MKGKIALILDHEPGERDPASPCDGVVSAEAAVPFRKVLAAQERGGIGVLFESDVRNRGGRRFNGLDVQSAEPNSNSVNIIGQGAKIASSKHR